MVLKGPTVNRAERKLPCESYRLPEASAEANVLIVVEVWVLGKSFLNSQEVYPGDSM